MGLFSGTLDKKGPANDIFSGSAANNANGGVWWKNLLAGTGVFFLNSLTNTVNANQAGNPYLPANQNAMALAPLAVLVLAMVLILKKR